jgi:hypothetical protein
MITNIRILLFREIRTVDSNGNGLGEGVAIGTLESRDLAKGAELSVLSRLVELGVGVSLSLNQLDVHVVGLSRDEDGDGARVVLLEGTN